MSTHQFKSSLVLTLCLLVGALLFSTAPAFAKEVHVYKTMFGGAGSGPGEFNRPGDIAVNDTTHDVYVVDAENKRVERFSGTGEYEGQFNGSGSYEDREEPMFEKMGTAAPTGQFVEPTQVAVDNSTSASDPSKGDVYVVDSNPSQGVVDKFSATGEYQGQLIGTPSSVYEHESIYHEELEGVAVDPSGKVWITQHIQYYANHQFHGGNFIDSYNDARTNKYQETHTSEIGPLRELAVDPEDNLYVNCLKTICKLNSSGAVLLNEEKGRRPFGGESNEFYNPKEQTGVAVDPVTGEVFIGTSDEQDPREAMVGAFSLDAAPIEHFGSGRFTSVNGLAVDASDGTVYVSDAKANTVSVFEGFTLPSVSVLPLSKRSPPSVTFNGSVDPEGEPVRSCVFEYDTREYREGEASHGTSVPCIPSPGEGAGEIGKGTGAVPVTAEATGLTPETQYYYRLVAQNEAPVASQSENGTFFAGPKLGDESVTDVAASSASLQTSVDPEGAGTEYRLEYGTSTAYEHSVSAGVGAGTGEVPVSVHLQTLVSGTVYHYRFVVMQNGEVFDGPDHVFSTQRVGGSSVLVDGRGWELVSPVDKHGALIELQEKGGEVQASADGGGIAYVTKGGSPGESPVGKNELDQVLSRRSGAGWSTEDITLPDQLSENGRRLTGITVPNVEYDLFSPDLSRAVVEPQVMGTPLLSPEATERTLYLRDDLGRSFLPLVTPGDVPAEARIEESERALGESGDALEWEMHFLAATPDLDHVVFGSPLALTPEAIDEESVQEKVQNDEPSEFIRQNLYEWHDGVLQLVNILPETDVGEVPHAPDEVAHGRRPVPLVKLAGEGESEGYPRGSMPRAISSDGRRVAWTWGNPYDLTNESYRGLYVRDMVEERTVKVGGPNAVYQTMNSEGSKIFYLENGDLYVYAFEAGTATDLTADHGPGEASGGVQELVTDVSEDGSHVYFVATGVLAEGGVSGAYNLYMLHDAAGAWTPTYIATLSKEDEPDWYAEYSGPNLSHITSRVSPNGQYLVFLSNRSLTGYDNTDALSGEPDEEVYEYNAQTGKLICASCDPTGARPVGIQDGGQHSAQLLVDPGAVFTSSDSTAGYTAYDHWLAGSVPGWDNLEQNPATYQPRYLSNNGRMFFDSPDGLVPQDTNKLEDVYEYEPEGTGDCTSSTSSATVVYVKELAGHPDGGCVGLISSGTSNTESAFYDASENGDDVFFDTTAQLSSQDKDKDYDLYDAHVCNSEGIPCQTEPVIPPPCEEGESCKAATSPQPEIFGPPPSATFNGAGNLAPPAAAVVKTKPKTKPAKCKRGYMKKKNKCVRPGKSKKTKARKADNHRRAGR